mmetsp:Transcript_3054/g.4898  ORF Transcript_3054/g.4898 Transcript_3054/m.4898 type:complete len:256 (+) Transcript_3054:479-1246(+)
MHNLVVTEPDAAVLPIKGEDVVQEGLHLVVPVRCGEGVREHLLDELEVRLLIVVKRGVEVQCRAGELEVVPCQLELSHGVHILHVKLHARPLRTLGQPHITVGALAALEEHRACARLHVRHLHHRILGVFGVQLAVLLAVRNERADVQHEVAVARGDAATAQNHALLLGVHPREFNLGPRLVPVGVLVLVLLVLLPIAALLVTLRRRFPLLGRARLFLGWPRWLFGLYLLVAGAVLAGARDLPPRFELRLLPLLV